MKTKQIFAAMLAAVMAACLLPTAAFAADTGKAIQLVENGTAANISGGQADNIYFGTYQQSSDGNGGYNVDPIEWRVLSNADGKLFLLADQNLDAQPYHSKYISITWANSSIRQWLNGTNSENFLVKAFSEGERAAIADTTVVNKDTP